MDSSTDVRLRVDDGEDEWMSFTLLDCSKRLVADIVSGFGSFSSFIKWIVDVKSWLSCILRYGHLSKS